MLVAVQKKIFKGCAIAFIIVLVLIIVAVITLPIIIETVEQNEKNKQINRAEIIGNYVLDGIADNSLSTETVYYLFADFNKNGENGLLPAKTDEIKEIINSEKFIDAYALDENSVLISEGVTFQTVTGYIVTNANEEIGKYIEVPEEFNYDGNRVTLTADLKENVYSFYAGL